MLCGGKSFSQESDLVFDKPYYKCENRYITFPQREDGSYMLMFLYLDHSAGFTFSYEGTFTIENNKYIYKAKERESRIIYRIEKNSRLLAIVDDKRIAEMKLPQYPDWLSNYQKGENDTYGQYRRGFIFNDVGASELALPILLKAYAKEPHFKGLEFEIAYAYNALNQPAEAVKILEKAIKNAPKDAMFYRELGYSYKHLKKYADAEKTYKKGIALSDNKVQQAEMAFNMAGAYYEKKDRTKYEEWKTELKKYADENSFYYNEILKMDKIFETR